MYVMFLKGGGLQSGRDFCLGSCRPCVVTLCPRALSKTHVEVEGGISR